MKLSDKLELRSEKHETLGEIFVLYSPVCEDGGAAYFLDFEEIQVETGVVDEGSGAKEVVTEQGPELGMGLRLTKETAFKLAWHLFQHAVGPIT